MFPCSTFNDPVIISFNCHLSTIKNHLRKKSQSETVQMGWVVGMSLGVALIPLVVVGRPSLKVGSSISWFEALKSRKRE